MQCLEMGFVATVILGCYLMLHCAGGDELASPQVENLNFSTTLTTITITWTCQSCSEVNVTGYVGNYFLTSNPNVSEEFKVTANVFSASGLTPRTNYTFQVSANHFSDDGELITGPSETITVATLVPSGVGFFLAGVEYSNNSVVSLADIGDSHAADSGQGLYCLTDNSSCCRRRKDGLGAGEWFLPGETDPVVGVHSVGSNPTNFTRSRAPSAAILNHVTAKGPTGVYTCQIPDGTGQNRTLYIGVGTTGGLRIEDLEYDPNSLTLTCTSHGRPVHSITWLKNNGVVREKIVQGQTITNPLTATYQHTLRGHDIADLVGNFTCVVGDAEGSIVNRTTQLTIMFDVTITASPVSSDFYTGLQLTLTCSIRIPEKLRSDSLEVSAQWTRDGFPLTSSARVTVGEEPVRMGPLLYESIAVLNSLDGSRDSGEYTCTGKIRGLPTVSATRTISVETVHFQLELRDIEDCKTWRNEGREDKINDVRDALVDNVASRCECGFTEDRITDSVFQCFPSSPQSVTYHAQLHGTHKTNASELFSILEKWAFAGMTIPVQFLPLTVTSLCVVGSTPLEDCPGDIILSSSAPSPSSSSSVPITTIIAGVAVVVFLVLTLLVIGIIILIYFCSRRKHSSKLDFSHSHRGLSAQLASLQPEETHHYEEIQKYNVAPGQRSEETFVASCSAEQYLASPKQPADTTTPTTALLTTSPHDTTGNTTGSSSTNCVIAVCPAYGCTGTPPADKGSVVGSEWEALSDKGLTYEVPMTKVEMSKDPTYDMPTEISKDPPYEMPMTKVEDPPYEMPMTKVEMSKDPPYEMPMTKVEMSKDPPYEMPMTKVEMSKDPTYNMPMTEVEMNKTESAKVGLLEDDYEYEVMKSAIISTF